MSATRFSKLGHSNQSSLAASRELVGLLAGTRLFAAYREAFSAASGLPLSIRPVESFQMPARNQPKENPFCALMAQNRKGCVACLQVQSDLESDASAGPRTQRCFAGLFDSMVPIRLGETTIGFLQTGQVALAETTLRDFGSVERELQTRGIALDSDEALAALRQSRLLSAEEYRGFLSMLELFADALAAAANGLVLKKNGAKEGGLVARARRYLETHYQEKISLAGIARVSGASERHFCKVFRAETGLTFVSYLNRYRVEKAQQRLRETNSQISEIAFEVGFDSIAQFNRTFKRYAGQSPRAYRGAAAA